MCNKLYLHHIHKGWCGVWLKELIRNGKGIMVWSKKKILMLVGLVKTHLGGVSPCFSLHNFEPLNLKKTEGVSNSQPC